MIMRERDIGKGLVVVAGAGISIAPPSNLPSWWGFNKLLIDEIKKAALDLLPNAADLINPIEIGPKLPVESVSDFFVRSIAGRSYFPLLTLLNAAQPNINHIVLAELARKGIISAIITTNFDTLIETAFRNAHVKLNVIVSDEDFNEGMHSPGCKLLKIHGSATDYHSLIDTTSQKMKGLSPTKRLVIKNIVDDNRVLFIGFSGADLSFDMDYIPIADALTNRTDITWVIRVGSSPHPNVIALKDKYGDHITIIEEDLPDLYKRFDIVVDDFLLQVSDEENSHRTPERLTNSVRQLIHADHISSYGCVSLCINMLQKMGFEHNAYQLGQKYSLILNSEDINPLNLPSYNIMGIRCMNAGNLTEAQNNFAKALACLDCFRKLHDDEQTATSDSINELFCNSATTWNNIGLLHMQKGDANEAERAFLLAAEYAEEAGKTSTLAKTMFNLARIHYLQTQNADNYIKELRYSEALAKQCGYVDATFEIIHEECALFLSLGEYYVAEGLIEFLHTLKSIVIDYRKQAAYELLIAELLVRKGNNADALGLCGQIVNKYCSRENEHYVPNIKHNMARLLIHYGEARDFLIKELEVPSNAWPEEETDLIYPVFLDNEKLEPWRRLVIFSQYLQQHASTVDGFSSGCVKYLSANDPSRLKDIAECFLDCCKRTHNSKSESIALYDLGCAELMLGRKEIAYGLFMKIEELGSAAKTVIRGWANIELANLIISKNPEGSREHYKLGINILYQHGDAMELIGAGLAHCKALADIGMDEHAINCAEDILSKLSHAERLKYEQDIQSRISIWKNVTTNKSASEEDLDDPRSIATEALSVYKMGDEEAAITGINLAMEKYRRNDDMIGVARCHNNLGNFALDKKQYSAAIDQFTKSLAIKEKCGDVDGAITQMLNIVNIYLVTENYKELFLMSQKAELYAANNGHTNTLLHIYYSVARACLKNGQLAEALEYCYKFRDLAALENDPSFNSINNQMTRIAELIEKNYKAKPQEPLNSFSNHLNECERLHSIGKIDECHEMLNSLKQLPKLTEEMKGQIEATRANAFMNSGDYERAIEYFRLAISCFENSRQLKDRAIHHLSVAYAKNGQDRESVDIIVNELNNEGISRESRFMFLHSIANRMIEKGGSSEFGFEQIKKMLDECITLTNKDNESNGMAHCSMMDLYILYGEKEMAKKHYLLAKEKFIKSNSRYLALMDKHELLCYLELL